MTAAPVENIISGFIMIAGIVAVGLYVIHDLKKRRKR